MKAYYPVLSVLTFLVLWQGLSLASHSVALPSPWAVVEVLKQELVSGQLLFHLAATLFRLLVSFSIAMQMKHGKIFQPLRIPPAEALHWQEMPIFSKLCLPVLQEEKMNTKPGRFGKEVCAVQMAETDQILGGDD